MNPCDYQRDHQEQTPRRAGQTRAVQEACNQDVDRQARFKAGFSQAERWGYHAG